MIRFHAYNEGTIMWPDKCNGAYRVTRYQVTFFPNVQSAESVLYLQFGTQGPHSYVITPSAGSQDALSQVTLVPNTNLPGKDGTNQYGFLGNKHLEFQWGQYTYAIGKTHVDLPAGVKTGCLRPDLPWMMRCVELQTGRWVADAIPRKAWRKVGYIDVCEPSMQHVLVATLYKALENPWSDK